MSKERQGDSSERLSPRLEEDYSSLPGWEKRYWPDEGEWKRDREQREIWRRDRRRDEQQWAAWRDRISAERKNLANTEENLEDAPGIIEGRRGGGGTLRTDAERATEQLISLEGVLEESAQTLKKIAGEMKQHRKRHLR